MSAENGEKGSKKNPERIGKTGAEAREKMS